MTEQKKSESFFGLGIAPDILDRLEKLGFKTPTPIQTKSIPIGIRGEDVIGIAQTGTGKTLAFSIPLIQQILAKNVKGLVILPTREIAIQVEEELRKLISPFGLRTAVIIGGAPVHRQLKALKAKPDIIIGTPGRINDLLEQKALSLQKVGILILDEADRMLDMGFEPQIKRILVNVSVNRQTLLFSATMPAKIGKIASQYMKRPLRVEVAPAGTTADKVDQEVFFVPKNQKLSLLKKLLKEHQGTVLVFSRTKHGAKRIARTLRNDGVSAAEIHSNRSLNQRKEAIAGFKSGKHRVLIATDIASRGIDVSRIELVINYDLPDQHEDYVHRIGRTGRAGRAGKAISFASPEQKRDIQSIERLIRTRLKITKLPEGLPAEMKGQRGDERRPQGRTSRKPRGDSYRSRGNNSRAQGGIQRSRDGKTASSSSRNYSKNRNPKSYAKKKSSSVGGTQKKKRRITF